jgi:hypothetical protein
VIKAYKNNGGYVYAYCEYQLVNEDGTPNDDGDFLYVFNAWVHEDRRSRKIIDRFIYDILMKHDNVKFVYWNRSKYDNKLSLYNVSRNGRVKMIKKENAYGF